MFGVVVADFDQHHRSYCDHSQSSCCDIGQEFELFLLTLNPALSAELAETDSGSAARLDRR